MKVLLTIAATICCWGVYGPILHEGQFAMSTVENTPARLRPLMCVGLAYFLIAVVVPVILLYARTEKGRWTLRGGFWSLLAGTLGAVGALGIILAFGSGGRAVFVMPLVFGGAPVMNSFVTIFMSKTYRQVGPVFIAGLILVAIGAFCVFFFKPGATETGVESLSLIDLSYVLASIGLVVLSWGSYGPVLHKGQMRMEGSRLRPLICVGLAYFAIAVVVPFLLLQTTTEASEFSANYGAGTLWSLGAGAAGALGALGVIMAFTLGGKPIYVMPLVFGGAPVVNTMITMFTKHSGVPGPLFYAGLIMVIAGAVMVLVFAPRGH